MNLVKYINGRVELRNDAPVGSVAFIRYSVLPVRDLATELNSLEYRVFDARFLDDGAGHVFLSLIQQNQSTGVLKTLMTFDSNASSPSASYQRGNTPGNPIFNFIWPILRASIPLTTSIMWKRNSAEAQPEGKSAWRDFPSRKLFLSCLKNVFKHSNDTY